MINKTILVTGGTGSCGIRLLEDLIKENVREIRVLTRNEFSQVEANKILKNPKIKLVVGDIRDKEILKLAMKDVNIIFHLAALKYMQICEEQPFEAIKTNILGTENIVEESILSKVEKVIYISTVTESASTYGLTKAIGEKIVLNANNKSHCTKFCVVRSGNILGTEGSIIPIFKKQLEMGKDIMLTHREMNRFFISLDNAIKNLIEICKITNGGEIFITKMPSFRIIDIAEIMLKTYGTAKNRIIETKLRQGEKLSEVLITKEEGENAYELDNKFYVLLPEIYNRNSLEKVDIGKYSSDKVKVNKDEVERILKANNYIA